MRPAIFEVRSRHKKMQNGRWGPYRQASPPPARHRPGARSARRKRCLCIVSQTPRRDSMIRHSFAASVALAVLVVLGLTGPVVAGEHVPFKGSLEGVDTAIPLTPP